MARKKLGELLVQAGIISETSLRAALAEQRRWGGTLGRTLIEMKMLREDDLVNTLSNQLGIQAVDLDAMAIPANILAFVPGELAQQWSLVPFAQPMKFLDVAMSDPTFFRPPPCSISCSAVASPSTGPTCPWYCKR